MNTSQAKSVASLMDTARVAEFLSVTPELIRTWVRRKGTGAALTDMFPAPLSVDDDQGEGGLLNRGYVWHRSEVEEFAKWRSEYVPRSGPYAAREKADSSRGSSPKSP